MIINEELFALENQCYCLIERIKNSDQMKQYKMKKQKIMTSNEVVRLKKDFLVKKEAYEKLFPYGNYAPGFRESQRAVRMAKRQLDLNKEVAAFRLSETELQKMLDSIVQQLARAVSYEIKIDAGSPFFEERNQSKCGGNCHGNGKK
ncbi:hypothetical protein A5844_000249 [Enterococcus sp. 10A9_DIV0425]|uniref:Uncharacterized protein n=1 Tax=Candidatus Enterococcus wittei TaxID=1987383 RepID=A0A2C9XRJ6_9ENTE|nr:YlbF family regulator [Enterococcus sp. 10A9_DIV0425]OTP12034.1 hypothetical protein A5844_000249 [Enterococcus sp. 10A9_DIV0425]THE10105.1 YlbF family regulator [Enterococcus hirae]